MLKLNILEKEKKTILILKQVMCTQISRLSVDKDYRNAFISKSHFKVWFINVLFIILYLLLHIYIVKWNISVYLNYNLFNINLTHCYGYGACFLFYRPKNLCKMSVNFHLYIRVLFKAFCLLKPRWLDFALECYLSLYPANSIANTDISSCNLFILKL